MLFDAGILNKKIDIIKPASTVKDGWDTVTDDNIIYKRISAAIVPARGKEYYEAKKIANTEQTKIIIRYRKNIDDGCLVKYKEHTFEIQSIIDVNMIHEILELYCIKKTRGNNSVNDGGWQI